MHYSWSSRIRWMTPIFKDWGFFSFSYFALALESIVGLGFVVRHLSPVDFSEWAVLSALITVMGAISQLGLKTAYMQLVADRTLKSRQTQALRAAFVLLGLTGLLAGLVISLVLGVSSLLGYWDNTNVLWVLPGVLMLGNLQMVLVTELRVSQRVASLVKLGYQRAIIFVAVMFVFTQFLSVGLELIYWGQLCANAYMVLRLIQILKIHRFFSVIRWEFLPSAISLGWPVMLGLLLKYGADAMVSMGMRWMATVEVAANYGRAVRILEPFSALFFTAFVMAWGANTYLMAADSMLKKHLVIIAKMGLLICVGGVLLAYPVALGMQLIFLELAQTSLLGPEFLMVLARLAAFAAISPVQFGWIVSRNYRWGMMFNGLEFMLTAVIYLVLLWQEHDVEALLSAALIPWCMVGLQYLMSVHLYRAHQASA